MSILTDLNPESLAIKALVVVAVVGGAYAFGHHQGYSGEKLVYDNYVLKQKSAADAQVIANKDALAAQKGQYDAQIKSLKSEYADNAQHLQASRDAAFASAASYAGQLRNYLAVSHASPQHASVPGAVASTSGTDTAGSNGLLDGVSSLNWYLTQRFSDADGIAAKFNEAVGVIAEDRKVCNGSLPGVTPQ